MAIRLVITAEDGQVLSESAVDEAMTKRLAADMMEANERAAADTKPGEPMVTITAYRDGQAIHSATVPARMWGGRRPDVLDA